MKYFDEVYLFLIDSAMCASDMEFKNNPEDPNDPLISIGPDDCDEHKYAIGAKLKRDYFLAASKDGQEFSLAFNVKRDGIRYTSGEAKLLFESFKAQEKARACE